MNKFLQVIVLYYVVFVFGTTSMNEKIDTDEPNVRKEREVVDFSNAITDPVTGLKCVEKTNLIESKETERVLDCIHSNINVCHYTYVTKFTSQRQEECNENFEKVCVIDFAIEAINETIQKCYRPAKKECNNIENGKEKEEICRTVFESHCSTKYVKKSEKGNKFVGLTECEKIPKELCGASSCVFVPGLEECHNKTTLTSVNVPNERCELQPQKTCKGVYKLVPYLIPEPTCKDVPREVCSFGIKGTNIGEKPIITKWCYDENEIDNEVSQSQKNTKSDDYEDISIVDDFEFSKTKKENESDNYKNNTFLKDVELTTLQEKNNYKNISIVTDVKLPQSVEKTKSNDYKEGPTVNNAELAQYQEKTDYNDYKDSPIVGDVEYFYDDINNLSSTTTIVPITLPSTTPKQRNKAGKYYLPPPPRPPIAGVASADVQYDRKMKSHSKSFEFQEDTRSSGNSVVVTHRNLFEFDLPDVDTSIILSDNEKESNNSLKRAGEFEHVYYDEADYEYLDDINDKNDNNQIQSSYSFYEESNYIDDLKSTKTSLPSKQIRQTTPLTTSKTTTTTMTTRLSSTTKDSKMIVDLLDDTSTTTLSSLTQKKHKIIPHNFEPLFNAGNKETVSPNLRILTSTMIPQNKNKQTNNIQKNSSIFKAPLKIVTDHNKNQNELIKTIIIKNTKEARRLFGVKNVPSAFNEKTRKLQILAIKNGTENVHSSNKGNIEKILQKNKLSRESKAINSTLRPNTQTLKSTLISNPFIRSTTQPTPITIKAEKTKWKKVNNIINKTTVSQTQKFEIPSKITGTSDLEQAKSQLGIKVINHKSRSDIPTSKNIIIPNPFIRSTTQPTLITIKKEKTNWVTVNDIMKKTAVPQAQKFVIPSKVARPSSLKKVKFQLGSKTNNFTSRPNIQPLKNTLFSNPFIRSTTRSTPIIIKMEKTKWVTINDLMRNRAVSQAQEFAIPSKVAGPSRLEHAKSQIKGILMKTEKFHANVIGNKVVHRRQNVGPKNQFHPPPTLLYGFKPLTTPRFISTENQNFIVSPPIPKNFRAPKQLHRGFKPVNQQGGSRQKPNSPQNLSQFLQPKRKKKRQIKNKINENALLVAIRSIFQPLNNFIKSF